MPELNRQPLLKGIHLGFPIFLGYFPAAMAFGLLGSHAGLELWELAACSMFIFAGAAQYMIANMLALGSGIGEIIPAVFFLNLRHLLFSTVLRGQFEAAQADRRRRLLYPFMIAFGVTDESFAVASGISDLSPSLLLAIEITAWSGWVAGTLTGGLAGSVIPPLLGKALAVTLYALFSILIIPELKKGIPFITVAAAAAAINTLLIRLCAVPFGWAIIVSMSLAAFLGTVIFRKPRGVPQ